MFNKKGQEAAPFELLIAVIVMGFVIFVGMQAMERLYIQKCFGTTDAKLEEMKTILEVAVDQKSPQSINFRLSGCFNEEDELMKITDWDEPSFCADFCGSPKKLCTLLEYSYSGKNSFSVRKCLNIPPDTVFPSQSFAGAKCRDREDTSYELQDFDVRIPQGDYLLTNATLATDTFPTICAYYREI
ncbi:MAG: hypothetical protein CL943_03515 [Candidatus Diapherotrites archaeon]|uniref:Class III signal peptide-containing protein n=1 Tax=Candidatus Iainarchaeum sp. TaxID=3101447 RepID=A0A2D6M1N2_9ARCH|nr:hypothetical protein [Candidatus Diapherotrites archaeon]